MGERSDGAAIEHPPGAPGAGAESLWEGGTQIGGDIAPEVLAELDRAWDKPKPIAGVLLAVVLALVVQAFLIELPNRPASGPWMGFALLPEGTLPEILPPLWHALTRALSAFASLSLVRSLFIVSMGGSALAAAAVAALSAHLVARDTAASPWRAGFAGAAAGGIFGASFIAAIARYGAGPEALAAALALWGVFCLLRAYDRRGLTPELMLSACCIGGACIDQPYYLALFVAVVFYLFLFQRDDGYQRERVFALVFVFAFTLAVPTLALLRNGVSIRALTEHLLHLPFPDASWRPRDFAPRWPGAVAFLTLAPLVAFGLLGGVTSGAARREILFLLLLTALLGPAMYYLADPPAGQLVPIDVDSPKLAAFGLLCAAAIAGAARLAQSLPWSTIKTIFVVVFIFICGFVAVWEGGERLADADAFGAKRLDPLVRELLGDTPQGALVAVGDLDTAGTLWAMQSAGGLRNDLRIVPVPWLSRRTGRVAAQALLGNADALGEDFPDAASLERWKRDLPTYVGALGEGPIANLETRLEQFALWDLVSAESSAVYFIAVDAPWVLARATPQGHRLVYPAENATPQLPGTLLGALNQGDCLLQRVTEVINLTNAHAQAARVLEGEDPDLKTAVAHLESVLATGKGVLSDDVKQDTDVLWRNDRAFALRDFYTRLAALPEADAEIFYQLAAAHAVLGQWQQTEKALAQWIDAGHGDETGLPGPGLTRLLGDSRFELFASRGGTFRLTLPYLKDKDEAPGEEKQE